MLLQPEIVKKMKDFGLNSYEAKIWAALLSRGVSSAGELSDISNVPRSRTYDVLESLEKKGFIIMKLGKPIKYMAIPPNEVINTIKKRIKEESIQKEKQIEELKDSQILTQLTELHQQGIETIDPMEIIGLVRNRNNLYDHLELLLKNAEKTVYIITTEEGLIRKLNTFKKTFKKLLDKNISIKIITSNIKNSQEISEFKNIEIKTIININMRLIIIDDKAVLFMITDDKELHPDYDTGVWIKTPYFAKALKEMFEHMWKKK